MRPQSYLQKLPSRLTTKRFGRDNVDYGDIQTFCQDGDFSECALTRIDGEDVVTARGPNPVYRDVILKAPRKLTDPFFAGKLFVIPVTGQSIGVAGGVGSGGEATETTGASDAGAKSLFELLPGKFLFPAGGSIPNPEGASSTAKDTFWPEGVYATLVDAKEAINYLRNPNRDQSRECPFTTAVLHFALALPDSSKVVVVNGALGSCEFKEVWGNTLSISGWLWDANGGDGRLTYYVTGSHSVQVGEEAFTVSGASPSGGNATSEVTAVSPSGPTSSVTVKMASDPGAWSSGGTFTNRAASLQGIYRFCEQVRDVLAPALGLEPELYAVMEFGHESNSRDPLFVQFLANATLLQTEAQSLQTLLNPTSTWVPWIVPIEVGWPRGNWQDLEQKVGEASWWAIGWTRIVRQALLSRIAPVAAYFARAGFGQLIGSPHYGSYGSQRFGSGFGETLIDIGFDTFVLPGILTAQRNANSRTVNFTLTDTSVKDTTEVYDDEQGCGGIRLYNADIDDETTRELTEVALASAATDGTSVTAAVDIDPRRNVAGIGLTGATETAPWCGRLAADASWDGSTVTIELEGSHDHGLPVGMEIRFFQMFAAPNNGIKTITIAEGSTGNLIKYASATDPGTFTPGGQFIQSYNAPVGNRYGLRSCYRHVVSGVPNPSRVDGAPVYGYWAHDAVAVRVDPEASGWAPAAAEIRGKMASRVVPAFKWCFDPADADSIASGNLMLANLGSTGSAEDYYNGLTSGSGAGDRDFTHSGVYDSKKRTGYFYVPAAQSALLTPVAPGSVTTLMNAHKAWSEGSPNQGVCWGIACGRYVTSSNNQHPWSTLAGEGATQGPGAMLRFASNKAQLFIRGDSATAWSLTSTVTLATGDYYVIAWYFRNGGISWLYVNGTIIYDTATTFSSPSSSAPQNAAPLICGNTIAASATARRYLAGHEFHGLELSDEYPGFDLEFGDLEPFINGARKRMLENAYS